MSSQQKQRSVSAADSTVPSGIGSNGSTESLPHLPVAHYSRVEAEIRFLGKAGIFCATEEMNRIRIVCLKFVVLLHSSSKSTMNRKKVFLSIYLKPGYERKGLGQLALAQIERHAHDHGFHVLVATICSENANSLRLFLQQGFEQCALYKEVGRKFGRWLDVTACQKILD